MQITPTIGQGLLGHVLLLAVLLDVLSDHVLLPFVVEMPSLYAQ